MKFEFTEVWGFAHALRGMRNPKNSWDKSDSGYTCSIDSTMVCDYGRANKQIIYGCQNRCHGKTNDFVIGPNDMKLAQALIRAGSEHRKFMRQIFVSVDITAPLFFWKQFDTYKVGTTSNSTSTMHKLSTTPITLDCFETDDMAPDLLVFEREPYNYDETVKDVFKYDINVCESLRKKYLATKDKRYWKELIRKLPDSWLQRRTITMTYENLLAMCGKGQRRFHKLNEWSGQDDNAHENFIKWARTLPYAQELIFLDELDNTVNE